MRVCDICRNADHQPVNRASIHVRSRSGGALDICDPCLEIAAENRSPARRAGGLKRLQPWAPRELTDSDALEEDGIPPLPPADPRLMGPR